MERPEIFPLQAVHPMILLKFLDLPEDPGVAQLLFSYFQESGIILPFVLEEPGPAGRNLLLLVDAAAAVAATAAEARSLLLDLSQARDLTVEAPVAMVRIFGPHFDIRPGLAAILYNGLARAGVHVLAGSTTITSTLLVVPEQELERLIRVLRTIFLLPRAS